MGQRLTSLLNWFKGTGPRRPDSVQVARTECDRLRLEEDCRLMLAYAANRGKKISDLMGSTAAVTTTTTTTTTQAKPAAPAGTPATAHADPAQPNPAQPDPAQPDPPGPDKTTRTDASTSAAAARPIDAEKLLSLEDLPAAQLLDLHERLAAMVAPATPASLRATSREGMIAMFYRPPVVGFLAFTATVCAIGFIITSAALVVTKSGDDKPGSTTQPATQESAADELAKAREAFSVAQAFLLGAELDLLRLENPTEGDAEPPSNKELRAARDRVAAARVHARKAEARLSELEAAARGEKTGATPGTNPAGPSTRSAGDPATQKQEPKTDTEF